MLLSLRSHLLLPRSPVPATLILFMFSKSGVMLPPQALRLFSPCQEPSSSWYHFLFLTSFKSAHSLTCPVRPFQTTYLKLLPLPFRTPKPLLLPYFSPQHRSPSNILFILFIFSLPHNRMQLYEDSDFYKHDSQLYPQYLEQRLAYSVSSINICC